MSVSAPNSRIKVGISSSPPATPSRAATTPNRKARHDAGYDLHGSGDKRLASPGRVMSDEQHNGDQHQQACKLYCREFPT